MPRPGSLALWVRTGPRRVAKQLRSLGRACLAVGALLAAAPGFALTVESPSYVLMVDGTDANVTVNVSALDGTWPLNRYDFGFLAGSSYTRITNNSGLNQLGSWQFNGGDVVNFALRDRGLDGLFGTADDLIYSIGDPLDYTNQIYSLPIDPSHSQNPVVTSPYYRSLIIAWDLDRNGVTDAGFDIGVTTPLLSYDGIMPTPVPLPGAIWLLGSGLLGLAGLARRRARA